MILISVNDHGENKYNYEYPITEIIRNQLKSHSKEEVIEYFSSIQKYTLIMKYNHDDVDKENNIVKTKDIALLLPDPDSSDVFKSRWYTISESLKLAAYIKIDITDSRENLSEEDKTLQEISRLYNSIRMSYLYGPDKMIERILVEFRRKIQRSLLAKLKDFIINNLEFIINDEFYLKLEINIIDDKVDRNIMFNNFCLLLTIILFNLFYRLFEISFSRRISFIVLFSIPRIFIYFINFC